MKKLLVVFMFLLVFGGCETVINVDKALDYETVSGVVVDVSTNSILVAQKDNFDECDFLDNREAYIESDMFYDLIDISDVTAEIGDIVTVTIEPNINDSYPSSAKGVALDVITKIEKGSNCDGMTIIPPKEEVPFSTELLDLFPKTLNLEQQYHGYAEYGHLQVLQNIENNETNFLITFKGMMMDGFGHHEERTFNMMYEVTDNYVVETIDNHDEYSRHGSTELLNSIIPQKVIIKLPLEVGTTWNETFEYQGAEYSAKSSIVRSDVNDAGNHEYEVSTVVEDIEGFYNDTYKETRVFEEGRGMTSFQNLMSRAEVGVEYAPEEDSEDLYLFGYSLSTESVTIVD